MTDNQRLAMQSAIAHFSGNFDWEAEELRELLDALDAPKPEISDELLQALALKFLGDEYDDDLEGLREFARAITWR